MEAVCSTRDKEVVIGNFNFHVELVENLVTQSFLGLMEAFGLTQCVASPTHIKGHTLDLVFTRVDNFVSPHITQVSPVCKARFWTRKSRLQ